jgi:protein NUD1
MNPCTLGWYLPLLVKDVPGALQPSEGGGGRRGESALDHSWQELDAKFRRDLPDEAYIGRLAYRGLVMRACPRIRMLDGVEVTEKERTKAQRLLVGILNKGKRRDG